MTLQNERSPSHISIVEKLSSTTISIRWSDPCLGHYANQIWGIGLARADAICVLSGKPIRRGDSVFRPRAYRSQVPVNHHRMMLASAVSGYLQRASR
ncbi:DUF3331 domain-containing protein [Paraburkholderia azotifigens]|uniref:DUF3331 domain-containing protein n=1 Tax=Paraburkholderia azotifigens TaxID=2057004 RepID=UPI001E4C2B28